VMQPLVRPFLKTPADGAATPIYLASSGEVEGVTGRYFAKRKPKASNKASYDTAAAARLWRVSAGLVGLPLDPIPAARRSADGELISAHAISNAGA